MKENGTRIPRLVDDCVVEMMHNYPKLFAYMVHVVLDRNEKVCNVM